MDGSHKNGYTQCTQGNALGFCTEKSLQGSAFRAKNDTMHGSIHTKVNNIFLCKILIILCYLKLSIIYQICVPTRKKTENARKHTYLGTGCDGVIESIKYHIFVQRFDYCVLFQIVYPLQNNP